MILRTVELATRVGSFWPDVTGTLSGQNETPGGRLQQGGRAVRRADLPWGSPVGRARAKIGASAHETAKFESALDFRDFARSGPAPPIGAAGRRRTAAGRSTGAAGRRRTAAG